MGDKPELLLPAGNTESFFAALQAGADAVYLGLDRFNARGRAQNFTQQQLGSIISEAKKYNVKVYITLNTIIKNAELPVLVEYLYFLQAAKVDGVIIQDWGVFSLIRKYFPCLKMHASTQLALHNSAGVVFAEKLGFKRVVLARELTLPELEIIISKSTTEIEVFVHGALCYSFSGMCLFSSYIGGRGANRGLCAQPCRREYFSKDETKFLFNLKDNQLIDFIPKLADFGIKSLKVEGRLKSGEYTYRVGAAYRKVLDTPDQINIAKKELELDLGRTKTSYFIGHDVKNSVSDVNGTGIYLGEIKHVKPNEFFLETAFKIEQNFRLRIHQPGIIEPISLTVAKVEKVGSGYMVQIDNISVKAGSRVFLTKIQERKFNNKFKVFPNSQPEKIPVSLKNSILNVFKTKKPAEKAELFFRIGSVDWLSRINFNELNGLFLSFSKKMWGKFDFSDPFLKDNKDKISIELPKFISEKSLDFYVSLAERMIKNGFRNFVISHLSQKVLIPSDANLFVNENVYAFNDAAIQLYREEGIRNFVYPQEADFGTLESINDKSGIVPIFFYPELFYSRMPVQWENNETYAVEGDNTKFRRLRKDGITIVIPDRPVSILQHKNKLSEMGFSRFLIDVSYDTFSKNRLKTLKTRFLKSEQIQPSTTFNFVKGMK